jgi:hypothetical protein
VKKLHTTLGIFEADKIFKGNNYIIGMSLGQEIFSFRGITDFTGYHIEDGQWDAEINEIEELRKLLYETQEALRKASVASE